MNDENPVEKIGRLCEYGKCLTAFFNSRMDPMYKSCLKLLQNNALLLVHCIFTREDLHCGVEAKLLFYSVMFKSHGSFVRTDQRLK